MAWRTLSRFRLLPRRDAFTKHDDGGVTIFAVIAFSMLLVLTGLVIDVGRVMNVHSQANSYADRVALAAAAELDGRSCSIARAIAAATGQDVVPGCDDETRQIPQARRLTLSGDSFVDVERMVFLSDLGTDPANPFARFGNNPFTQRPSADDRVTAFWRRGMSQPTRAPGMSMDRANRTTRFVMVETTREREDYLFFPLLSGAVSMEQSATVAPQAVAGFEQEVCNAPPLMLCNLAEATNGRNAAFSYTPNQMIRARLQGEDNDWAPGVYSVINAPSVTNTTTLRNYMGALNPSSAHPDYSCSGRSIIVRRGMNDSAGRRTAIRQGLNFRFDIFDGNYSLRTDPRFPPAHNVTKGLQTDTGDQCDIDRSDDTIPFPRDPCFMPGGDADDCVIAGGRRRAGHGDWDWDRYWDENHPDDPNLPARLPNRPPYNNVRRQDASRYQIYRYEIDFNLRVREWPEEIGRPICSPLATTPDETRDRRVLPVAIVNCVEYEDELEDGEEVPVEAYAEVFLTEPAGEGSWYDTSEPSTSDLYIEVIGPIRRNLPDNIIHEFPVLAR